MQLVFTGNNPGSPQNNNRMDGYSYDAAGNVLNDGVHSYTYDAENRIIKVDNGNTASYVYGPEGNRVEKTSAVGSLGDPAGTYIFGCDQACRMIWRLDSTGGLDYATEIYAGSRHLASQTYGNTYFRHADWLGTQRLQTAYSTVYNPAYYNYCSSLPFGEPLGCQSGTGVSGDTTRTALRFTGKEHDAASGLDYFGARYDASNFGRFLSPDPIHIMKQKFVDPQQWNMYAYARNNPLSFLDPTGMYICSGTAEQCKTIKNSLDKVKQAANNFKEGSKERNALEKIIGFYGKERKDNGVTVKFGDAGGNNANTVTEHGKTTITFDLNEMHQTFSNRNDGSREQVEFAATAAHEGQHGIDDKAHGNSSWTETQEYTTEKNAFNAQSWVNKGLNANSAYTGLWDVGWTTPYAQLERIFGVQNWARKATAEWCNQPGAPCQ